MAKHKAVVVGPRQEHGRQVWYYTCQCPKISGGFVGPFDLERLAKDVANLHNRAEPNH